MIYVPLMQLKSSIGDLLVAKKGSDMSIKLFSVIHDDVVGAAVGVGETAYDYALTNMLPLISRLDIQRRVQDPKFYSRLTRDILTGCVMPPITIAFLVPKVASVGETKQKLQDFCNENIKNGFVLDGIQRLNALARARDQSNNEFPGNRTLFINIIACSSMDSLLYRMITLNNGQRAMTMRHQIEILMEQVDFSGTSLKVMTEKKGGSRKQGYFRQGDLVLAYLAFLSGSTTVDTQKLIEERLDQILAAKVLEAPPKHEDAQFFETLKLMEKWLKADETRAWFKVTNNLIGFCAGARQGLPNLKTLSAKKFSIVVANFDMAFSAFDVSKIKLGQARRDCLAYFIGNFKNMQDMDINDLTGEFAKRIS